MSTLSRRLAAATFACVSLGLGLQARAAPPAAPSVTVGADMKQLRFDAAPVSGASYYQLWFRANGGAPWVKYMDTTDADPLFKVTVSAHLLDWFNARYRVAACNADGCRNSADIHVTGLMRDTVGYFKPRVGAVEPFWYGYKSVLSADGNTIVVLSGEKIGVRSGSVRAYVYRKGSSGWQQEARLEPAPVEEGTATAFAHTLAVNGDGTVIALGVPSEYIPGPQAQPNGAVYVYRRTGSGWVTEKKIQLNRDWSRNLGKVVALDDAGVTLAIWRSYNDSDITQTNPDIPPHQPIEIYRHTAAGWESAALINTIHSECDDFALSGDGKVLAQTCSGLSGAGYVRVYEAPDWGLRQTLDRGREFTPAVDLNYDGSLIVTPSDDRTPAPAGATWTPRITVYRRGTAGWFADPAFTHIGKARNPPTGIAAYGQDVAISRDGRFVAVTDPYNSNGGTGVVHSPLTVTSIQSGAVFIYEHSATAWRLRNMIKPNVDVQYGLFGSSLAFGDNGKILAVGAMGDPSGARGIDGDQTDTSAPESGAAWLY